MYLESDFIQKKLPCISFSYCLQINFIFSFTWTEELVPILNERAGLPQGTELALFEEIKPNLLERLADLDRPLEKVNFMNSTS